jgi:hypothetical protein
VGFLGGQQQPGFGSRQGGFQPRTLSHSCVLCLRVVRASKQGGLREYLGKCGNKSRKGSFAATLFSLSIVVK